MPFFLRLIPSVKNYSWGVKGENSLVATLYSENLKHIPVERHPPEAKPIKVADSYAELWIGAHPSGMSHVLDDNCCPTPLNVYLKNNPDFYSSLQLSEEIPFLLKVLSIALPLSIQAHPDKKKAEELHAQHPLVYKDSNHKPEMAIALGPFEAFCGFMSFREIAELIRYVPALQLILGEEYIKKYEPFLDYCSGQTDCYEGETTSLHEIALKEAFSQLLNCDETVLAKAIPMCLGNMEDKLKNIPVSFREKLTKLYKQLSELHSQFGQDIGIFAVFFLQRHYLRTGEALFIGPNQLHSYISGNCIECMATSDNVLRGGLTSKFKDAKVLEEILYYDDINGRTATRITPQFIDISSKSFNAVVTLYRPPPAYKEFQIFEVKLGVSGKLLDFSFALSSLAICLVLQGSVVMTTARGDSQESISLKTGDTIVIRPSCNVSITSSLRADDFLALSGRIVDALLYVVSASS